MSRIAMAQVVQSSVRFVGSHMQYTQDLRLPNLRLKTKYDRQGEASFPSLNKSFDISPGYHLRSIPLSGPTQSLRYIHDPDSWYWTSAQIREYLEHWCLNPPKHIGDVLDRREMAQLYFRVIQPSCENRTPFVTGLHKVPALTYLTVGHGHGSRIPITEFYAAMGWVISMVESRGSGPLDYCKVLATYAKWCYTMWKERFPGTCVPTTASIKVVKIPSRSRSSQQSFWVSTSLPHAKLKEEARLIREKYMHDLFGRLPDAPIFVEAVKQGGDWGRIKWGHCAETLTTMCSYFRVPLPGSVCGVTIKLKPVAKAPKYLQATFMDATLEACDNCKAMMRHANIVYRDWYHQGCTEI